MGHEFSGNCDVASRNTLLHNGATNATRSRLSDSEEAPTCRTRVLGAELDGSLATLNFRELLFQRLSGNSEQAPLGGPTSLPNGQKGAILGASRYQKTRDPTRKATFQTVSPRTPMNKGFGRDASMLSRDEHAEAQEALWQAQRPSHGSASR
jgi:hypothetical protein